MCIAKEPLHKPCEEFVCLTIPKSGTHLLANILYLLSGRGHTWSYRTCCYTEEPQLLYNHLDLYLEEQRFLLCHHSYSPRLARMLESRNTKVIFCVRDPRDVCLSLEQWWSQDKISINQVRPTRWATLKHGSKIDLLLSRYIPQVFYRRIGWITSPNVLVVKYEDMVGEKGGGSNERQYFCIRRIARHLGAELTDEEIRYIAETAYGHGRTFYKGTIGRWKKEFSPWHKILAERHLRGLLLALGYLRYQL